MEIWIKPSRSIGNEHVKETNKRIRMESIILNGLTKQKKEHQWWMVDKTKEALHPNINKEKYEPDVMSKNSGRVSMV